MNVQNNTVKSVLSQATNADGTRKAGVWPTKGYTMLDDGTINAEINDTGVSINGKHVSTACLSAKALQPVFEGGETLAQWLSYMEGGFVSFQQQRAATGSAPTVKAGTSIDESLLTADEREAYLLAQLVPASPVLLPLYTTANNAAIDIDDRITAATEALAALKTYKKELSAKRELTQEQKESIALQRVKEARFDTIIEAGGTVTRRTKDIFSCSVSLAIAANVIPLIVSDFLMVGSPSINTTDMTSVILFKDKPEA